MEVRGATPARRVTCGAFCGLVAHALVGCSLLLDSADATFSDAGQTEDAGTRLENPLAFADEEAYLKATNAQAGDQFGGTSLAFDGNRLAVGSAKEASSIGGRDADPGDDGAPGAGAVYLYTRSESGWEVEAYLKPEDPQPNAGFEVVALSGDTLAVGAPARIGDAPGRVYVFTRDEDGWVQRGEALRGPEPQPGDEFGAALALSGDTLVVGAPGAEAVHVFTRGQSGAWTLEQSLASATVGFVTRFGAAIALSTNTLAIGAPQESSAKGVSPCIDFEWRGGGGVVYVFEHEGEGWTPHARIVPADIDLGASFGAVLALDGDRLVVGAPFEEPTLAPGTTADMFCASGAVHVLSRGLDGWTEDAELGALNPGLGDRFGTSVAVDGNRVVVGAPFEDSAYAAPFEDGLVESGAVYGFEYDGEMWRAGMIKASNGDMLDLFGAAVALSGDELAVGALDEDGSATGIDGDPDDDSAPGAGAVYAFTWEE